MMKKMIALFLVATLCVLSLAVVAWAEPATETSAQGDESLPEDSGEDAEMAEGADSDWSVPVPLFCRCQRRRRAGAHRVHH